MDLRQILMPKSNKKPGQARVERSPGIHTFKLEKFISNVLGHLVTQGYNPEDAKRGFIAYVERYVEKVSSKIFKSTKSTRDPQNVYQGFEAYQLMPLEQVKEKQQAYSNIPEGFEYYQSASVEELDGEEEEEEEEQSYSNILEELGYYQSAPGNEFDQEALKQEQAFFEHFDIEHFDRLENKYLVPGERPEKGEQASFDIPDGFENDHLMAMENLEEKQAFFGVLDGFENAQFMAVGNFDEEQALFDVPDGFENAQLMAIGDFDEEQACFNVSEGVENDQLRATENLEQEQVFFEFPEGFENAQLISKGEPEEEKQSFDAESSQHWGSIDYIPHEGAISLVLGHVDPHDSVNSKDCEVSTSRGTFNKVFIVTLPGGTKYVLRVPRFGISVSWNSDEETAFLTTLKTMEYVRTLTNLPIPQVIAYDHTHDNAIKHPYSILSYFSGRNVYWVWGDATDPNLEATRQRILRSLARTVSALSKLSFNSHGSLQFEGDDIQSPHIGPEKRVTHHTYDPDVGLIHETRMRNPYDSHKAYLEGKLKKAEELGISTIASVPNTVKLGELKILRMLLKCFPTGPAHLDAEGRERFSIVPPDFDWQNILVDDDGNVTGLIDWDDMRTQHGLKGWASCPRFLRTDWIYAGMPPWEEDINMSPQDLLRYRRDYANYISEAVNGEGDACFAMKSAVWQAIEQALKQSWDRTAILTKILTAAQPEIQHPQDFLHDVGRNGLRPDDEVELQMRFHAYLACSPGADTEHDV